MPSGGARARSGPPPDPNALRRDRDHAGWIHLPAAGREGDPPAWPLARPSQRELVIWAGEWRRPQAIAWEQGGRTLEVALYVRNVVRAEKPKASPGVGTLLLRQMTELGLTLGGLRANRWVIDDGDQQPSAAVEPVTTTRSSARERFAVIEGTGA
ncbi:MAG TPA: hypothetical protein VKR24_02215 [Candidatus Limnocylindrales bacterium]|nr:hypothetical protein [Candidatus Limnocylindrales bacterium]